MATFVLIPGASSRCDFSGVVLRAAGGRFSTAYWSDGRVLDFGPVPVESEVIAQRWTEIDGRR